MPTSRSTTARARLNGSLTGRKNQRERYILLYELFHSISSTLDPRRALELIVDAAAEITGATSAFLSLVDWEERVLEIQVSRGFVGPVSEFKLRVGQGITGWVASTGKALLVHDVTKDPRYYQLKKETRSELAVPLILDEQLIGVVNVESVKKNAFGVEDLELLTLLAKQSVQVIRNSRLFDTVQRKVEELSSLIEVSKTIARTLSLDKTLNEIVERAARLMQADLCTVRLLTEDRCELALKALYGKCAEHYDRGNISVAGSLTGQVVLTEKPLQVADVKSEPHYRFHEFARRYNICSLLSVPLKARDRIIGLLNINKTQPYRFSDEEVKLVRTFADLCAIAIENARLYENMVSLEEQARQAERLAVVGELAVGIAHEIRNPLTVIKMILESGNQLVARDRDVISAEMSRMNKIISRFLDFGRPTEPVYELCDVNKILRNALLLLSHALEKNQIKLKVEAGEDLPPTQADPVQLQQVFLNILLNSIEAMPAGGKIFVKTRARSRGGLEVRIQDNGPGLPSHVRQNLYVPFTTTKAGGLGLGLSIVKRIVEAHNGELVIESAVNRGTRTVVRLPVAKTNSRE